MNHFVLRANFEKNSRRFAAICVRHLDGGETSKRFLKIRSQPPRPEYKSIHNTGREILNQFIINNINLFIYIQIIDACTCICA